MSGDTHGPSTSGSIGPYKLLDLLGEGGMGEVWLAEQTEPVHRRVALKLIKLGMDTKQVLARLEAERQALAVMDHPNIASFYDGGATDTGRPYFVMELVQGVPITDYCDKNRFSTADRIRLFVDVCHAIQHAHHKGVIHRDLKPSNVLVTVKEGEPVVKIIDFGIAKALGQELTERTLVTRLGQIVGTPEYMSPEQAEVSGMDVDTRTDVYSLGVMLYELLVGALPFDFAARADQAIRSAIRETEVPRPSTKLTSLGETQDTIARYRRTTASALKRELRSDLDWVILQAMEKDRTRRYDTPASLALELERHLRHEPVLAHAPSATYRVGRFVRRHRAGVTFAGTIATMLIVSAVGMSIQAARVARERDRAEQEASKAEAVNEFLQTMLASANPWVGAREVRVADVIDQAVAEIDRELDAQPEVEAAVRFTLGRTYEGLGLVQEAETQVREALQIRRSADPRNELGIAEAMNQLGKIHYSRGEFPAADSLISGGLQVRTLLLPTPHLEVAESLDDLGAVRVAVGDYEAADSLLRAALDMRVSLLGEKSLEVAGSQGNLAALLVNQGQLQEAEALFRTALATRREIQGDHLDVTTAMQNLAITIQWQERLAEVEPLLREALEIQQRLLGDDHPVVARSVNNLAVFLWRSGAPQEAEPLLREALEINRRVLGDENPEVSSNLVNLSLVLQDQERIDEAETIRRQSLAIDRSVLGDDHPDVARSLNSLGGLMARAERYAEAEATFREAERIQTQNFGADSWQAATSTSMLGDVLVRMNRLQEAEPILVRSYEIIQAEFGDEHGRTQAALGRVIQVYEALGDEEKAAEYRGGGG
jgi:tetratricopeptide (TPR) repeat protein